MNTFAYIRSLDELIERQVPRDDAQLDGSEYSILSLTPTMLTLHHSDIWKLTVRPLQRSQRSSLTYSSPVKAAHLAMDTLTEMILTL